MLVIVVTSLGKIEVNMAKKSKSTEQITPNKGDSMGAESSASRSFKSSDALGGGGIRFLRPSQLAEEGVRGVVAEGYYNGTVANNLTGKNDFKITADDGSAVIINHTGHLASLIERMEVVDGNYVRVSYLGKEKMKKTGKEFHKFKLEVAE